MIDGVVIIDKPSGITSHDVVQRVKRIYNAKKAGHTGTLDPLATGVLPICLNKATKIAGQLMSGKKEYSVVMQLGITTDTFDTEGKILSKKEIDVIDINSLSKAVLELSGTIEQKPPYYSAVKYRGKPLYKWAREGQFIDVAPRTVEVEKFQVEKVEKDLVSARVVCSKGTYIRTLCSDLGEKLGTGACMISLRRISTGPFHIKDAILLENLTDSMDRERHIIDIKRYLGESGAYN